MIEGLICMTVGGILAIVGPVRRQLAYWRWMRIAAIGATLRVAVPIAAPDPSLDRLAAAAEAALDRDELLRGVAGIADIYRRA